MSQPLRILHLEDNIDDVHLVQSVLEEENIVCNVEHVDCKDTFYTAIEKGKFDIIFADFSLPSFDGMAALSIAREKCPNIPFILLSGSLGEELAIESLKSGATDYVLKQRLSRLAPAVRRAIKEANEQARRNQAEEALRDSEVRFISVVESANDAIILANEKLKIVSWNKGAQQIFGYKTEEAVGKNISILMADWYEQYFHELIKSMRLSDKSHKKGSIIESRGKRKDKTQFPMELSLSSWKSGQKEYYTWIIRDITERKKAEQALWESEERYRSLYSSMNEGVSLHKIDYDKFGNSVDYTILDINPAYETILGFKKEDIIGKKATEIYNTEEPPYLEIYTQVAESGKPASFETFFESLDKHFNISAFSPNEGMFATVFEDITQRKQAEAQISRLASLVEQASESIMLTDIKGYIEYVNPAFEKITGYRMKEVSGQYLHFLNSGKHDKGFFEDLWNTINAGKTWDGIFINKKKDGTLFQEHAVIFPIHKDGNLINFAAVKRDITKEKALESQLRQIQKLEAIGQLAGGIAHDFNNILTAVNGYAELILMSMTPDNKYHSSITGILSAGKRASNLTRQLLAFGRRQIIELKNIDLNKLIDDLDKMLYRLIGEDIKMIKNLANDICQIKADPGQMEQILINLIVNARDAILQKEDNDKEKNIIISTRDAILGRDDVLKHYGMKPGPYVILEISDTGIGMTEETMQKIFEPFFTTKETGKGTGLGLATVYGIVKQNNAFIQVYSELNKGATFKVYWPFDKTNKIKNIISKEQLKIKGGDEVILFVEDDAAVREFGSNALRSLGYNVIEAYNGIEALELINEDSKIDLLVSDVIMPGMGGKELADKLLEKLPNLKIIYTSGYTDNHIVKSGILKRGINFVQKPYSIGTLTEKVRTILDKESIQTKVKLNK